MPGKLTIVGLGPGGVEHLTPAARVALEASGVVVGYRTYLDLIPELLVGREVVSSGMRQEVERCREALERARAGASVALVSSGDPGIYGMAGLALELLDGEELDVEIVPGVSAVQAAAARLGAPLMHDFAVISLSDLLTPWELIRRRLRAAAEADFVVALYNPKSHGRTTQLAEAREILLAHRPPSTPVGIVRNACRPGETVTVTDLGTLLDHPVDMLSVVIVGNASTTVDSAGRMVTPRGYEVQGTRKKVKGENPGLSPCTLNLSPAPARALFIGGTGSDVGKSVVVAGLCRILKRRGVSVAPFKAQNMALNSAVTPQGGEIGRAQALQAAACGLEPHTDMNPVLLKPNSETGSQVIVQGRVVGNMSVSEYHAYKGIAFERVRESFARLSAAHEVVVLEGAGSIAEINLAPHDITNLRAAAMAGAPALLVADIDRGGVFAAIVGTLELLPAADRARVAGVVINRFRGDPSLLAPGIAEIEARTGVPVLGVVPWIDLRLPEEDSVALSRKGRRGSPGELRIGVVRLPRISNFTDFDPLEREAGVALSYLGDPSEVAGLDLLILPGTKNTLSDLAFLHEGEWTGAIRAYHGAGGRVAGICGGFQMLGRRVLDPRGMESALESVPGLGLLDVETELLPEKTTHQASGDFLPAAAAAGFTPGGPISGYEIHLGETRLGPGVLPLLRLTSRSGGEVEIQDGAISSDGRVWGSYLHGLFDDAPVRAALLSSLRRSKGLAEVEPGEPGSLERELDRLADHLERHLDLPKILGLLDLSEEGES